MRVLLLAGLLAVTGCASTSRLVVASMRVAAEAEPLLVDSYRLQQEACLTLPAAEQRSCVVSVRAKFDDLKAAYAEMLDAAKELEADATSR